MLEHMQRILDIDLDFFVTPVVYQPQTSDRPPDSEYKVWSNDRAFAFLRDKLRLTSPLPACLTETHDQLFLGWHEAITNGVLKPPFHVTHVDAHADLGNGDAEYQFILKDLVYKPIENRPSIVSSCRNRLLEGDFLALAVACHWISDLTYVFGEGGGDDQLHLFMKNFDRHADRLELGAFCPDIDLLHTTSREADFIDVSIPFTQVRAEDFHTESLYDMICLTRSPLYTPPLADRLYQDIREKFVIEDSR